MQDSSLYSQTQPQFPEQEHLKCPRCDSANTKFCYYNNYNLSQPRHFCRSCKRYWTKGGALRNIPVGGGSRKTSKRGSSSSSSAAAAKRPAAAASVLASSDKNDGEENNSGEMTETLPLKGQDFGNFSSVLGSNRGEFDSFLDGLVPNDSSLQIGEHFGDSGSGLNVDLQVGMESGSGGDGDGFLNIQGGGGGGGDTGCWGGGTNGWPDLSMYTPGPTFP